MVEEQAAIFKGQFKLVGRIHVNQNNKFSSMCFILVH